MNTEDDPRACGYNLFIQRNDEPATGYPLTREELTGLARYWWARYLDVWTFCILWGQTGSTALRLSGYACDRLKDIERILGESDAKQAYHAACQRYREELGDDVWQAYTAGRPLFYEEMSAKRHGGEATPGD